MINVGIIGCGFVGGALKDWLEHNNPECKLFISDPPKGYNDDLSGIDIAFLQIHVPTEDDGTQNLTLMKELITNLPDVPVFVRTTILPGTSERLSKETGHQVCYMPEFLTERTFLEDFRKQTMVFTGAQELLTKIFVGKKFTVMTPLEAELTKYMHNVFGAYKVTYFTGPDGKFGYGGKCFPKDVNAFAKMTEGTPLGTLLEHLHELNVHFRGVEEHI